MDIRFWGWMDMVLDGNNQGEVTEFSGRIIRILDGQCFT